MASRYLEILATPEVRAAQLRFYGREAGLPSAGPAPGVDPLGEDEMNFIRSRDSFYLASHSSSGWPYVQHRGGEVGFLKVLAPGCLGFADFRGNRQLITTGHAAADDRVSLLLMDYPGRRRLKILGRLRVLDAREDAELLAVLAGEERRAVTERLCVVEVVSFDWNCPKYIKPRFTAAEVEEVLAPLRARIRDLETALLRAGAAPPTGEG